jgi:hypothetical protein
MQYVPDKLSKKVNHWYNNAVPDDARQNQTNMKDRTRSGLHAQMDFGGRSFLDDEFHKEFYVVQRGHNAIKK